MKFALFGNAHQAKKSACIKQLLALLEKHGAEVYVDAPLMEYLRREFALDFKPAGLIEADDFDANVAISLGGDGTFLDTAARVRDKGTPILGINTGHLGFLADVSPEEIESAIRNLVEGHYDVEQHSVLALEYSKGKPQTYPFALNEVAVLKRDNSSMISIRVDINGDYLATYQADGLIINTPTGSTGYALSVGGPIMSPRAETFGITAVAPHSLNVRPIALRDNAVISLTVESRNHHFLVSIDGRSETCEDGTRLTLRRAPYSINVLKRQGTSFFQTLRNKLMLGSDVRVNDPLAPPED